MNEESEINKLVFKALILVNSDNNSEAEELVLSILNNNSQIEKLNCDHWQYIGDICITIARFDLALKAYLKANNLIAVAFTHLMLNNLEQARDILKNSSESVAYLWCRFLLELFTTKGNVIHWPGLLSIRQFLEITAYYLLLADNNEGIQLLLGKLNKLIEINSESEKYIGYAYYHLGKYEEAIKLLNSTIKINQFDGEPYLFLGKIYEKQGKNVEALNMYVNAKILLPSHYPVEELVNKIKAQIFGHK